MEDILAVVIVLALVIAFTFGLKAIIRGIAEKKAEEKRKQEESEKYWADQRKKAKERNYERLMESATLNTPTKKLFTPTDTGVKVGQQLNPIGSGVGRSTYTSEPVQSTRSVLDDVADIAMIANTVRHWNDNNHSEPAREERSVGVTKSESSWGFDDSDSRKSVSDTFSSSWSSSSSDSSSSWSSSDSGPSSDW